MPANTLPVQPEQSLGHLVPYCREKAAGHYEPAGGGMQHAAEYLAVAFVAACYLPEHRREPPPGLGGGLPLRKDGLVEDSAE